MWQKSRVRLALVNSLRVTGGGEKWAVRQAVALRERGVAPVIACRPDGGLRGLAEAEGLSVCPTPMPHDLSPAGVWALRRVFRETRPEVVLCCNERAYRLAAPAARLAGRPPLVYRNGLTGTFRDRALNRVWFRDVARLVVNSEALLTEMRALPWIPEGRLRLIRNGVDPAPYRPDPAARERVRAELGAGPDTPVIAILARVSEEKGHAELLAALARVPGAALWVAGEGGLLPTLRERAAALDVGGRVRFLGFRRDVPALLQGADVVAAPSHREGLGNTLLEAMAAGRPVVASAAAGNEAVVEAGVTGLLVPPRNVEALAAALGALAADPALRERFGAAGRRRVEAEFPLAAETAAWHALLTEVAAEARR